MIRLKDLRKQKSLTQQDLANFLEVSRSMIAMWETGRNMPDYFMLKKIATFFNVSISFLVGEENTPAIYKNNEDIRSALMFYHIMREAKEGFSLFKVIYGSNPSQAGLEELEYAKREYLHHKNIFDNIYNELPDNEKEFLDLYIQTAFLHAYNTDAIRYLHTHLRDAEMEIIVKIRALDERGRETVIDTIERETRYSKKISKKEKTLETAPP